MVATQLQIILVFLPLLSMNFNNLLGQQQNTLQTTMIFTIFVYNHLIFATCLSNTSVVASIHVLFSFFGIITKHCGYDVLVTFGVKVDI